MVPYRSARSLKTTPVTWPRGDVANNNPVRRFRYFIETLPLEVKISVTTALIIRVALAVVTRYTSEDFMITLRYAENLAHEHGMVYNIGERVLGTTTPLYTVFLSLAAWMHLSPTLCGKTVNILADGVLCILLYLWLRHERLEKAGRLAAVLAAVHPIHLQWAISGMETSLVTTVGVWAWYAFARHKNIEAYVALAVLFLLRWDSVLVTGVITASIWQHDRRLPLRGICLFALIVAPWLISASVYYGNPIPVTGQAKIQVYGWFADHATTEELRTETTGSGQGLTTLVRLEPEWLLRHLPRQQKLFNFFIGPPAALLLTALAATGTVRIIRCRRWRLAPALIWFVLYMAAFLLSRVLLFNWYLVPPFPVFELLAAIGAAFVARRATRLMSRAARRVLAYTLVTATVAAVTLSMAHTLGRSQAIEENARKPIGLWLKDNSHPGERILLEPIGYIGYYSQRPVIDVIGLVSPQVLRFYSATATSPWLAQIVAFTPEWCVFRPTELREIERSAAANGYDWKSNYALVHTWAYAREKSEQPLVFYAFRRMRRF
jgi:hypothetical protein